ncbi:putative ABC transport system permease protein [Streptacidiphilus sp. MAP12-16]|uniref:ABC transporter permease n=1 Tax=Streptacidiphilus sp. MAP12-16 TaxID=3156300 RepID=UPI003518C10F
MYRTALRNVLAHKGRLLMTMLAVLLGTAFVAGTMVFSDSVGQSFKDSISSSYTNISVQVSDTHAGVDTGPKDHTGTHAMLTGSTLRDIAALPGTATARGTVSGFAGLSDPHGNLIGSRGNTYGGNWVPGNDGQDAKYPMAQGTGPTDAHGIAIDQKTAKDNNFKVGDTVRMAVNGPVMQMTVTGVFSTDDPQVKAGGSLVLFDNATAQSLYLKPGQYGSIEATAKPGTTQDQLLSEIKQVVPHGQGINAETGAQLTADQASMIQTAMSGMRTALLAFAGIALFVGIFLISNTFTMLIAQRTRELALMRAIGASRRQITYSVLLEALFVGISASVVGLAAGIGIGRGMQSLMGSMGSQISASTLVISPTTVVATLLTGVLVTVMAALLPSIRASRVAPVAAMRSNDAPATQKSLIVRNTIGLALAGLGLAAVVLGAGKSGSTGQTLVGAGAVFTLVGVFVLTPLLSRPVIALVGPLYARLFGISGTLARQNAVRNPRRTAATASALTIGVTLISALTVIGASMNHAIDKQVTQGMRADYAISAMLSQPISPALLPAIAGTPGVTASSVLDQQDLTVNGADLSVTGVNAAGADQLMTPQMVSGSMAALGQGQILVDQEHATKGHWTVGSSILVSYPNGSSGQVTVGGIYQNSDLMGQALMGEAALSPHTNAPYYGDVLVKGGSGATPQLRQALKDATGDNPLIKVDSQQDIRDQFSSKISLMLNVMYGLLGMAVIIAILGVVNTLAMSVFERKREIGMLRAIGLDRRGIKRMVRLESVVIASFGAVLGVAIGGFLAWAAVRLLGSAVGGLTTTLPYGQLAAYVAGAALIGLMAALWPARRAARLDILGSIATD